MRLPRMTTRRWMIAVVVVAIILAAGIVLERRRESFRRLALHWASDEQGYSHALSLILPYPEDQKIGRDWVREIGEYVGVDPRGSGLPRSRLELGLRVAEALRPHRRGEGFSPSEVEWTRVRVEYADRLRIKYERAAAYPWLPVEPDPPVPE